MFIILADRPVEMTIYYPVSLAEEAEGVKLLWLASASKKTQAGRRTQLDWNFYGRTPSKEEFIVYFFFLALVSIVEMVQVEVLAYFP